RRQDSQPEPEQLAVPKEIFPIFGLGRVHRAFCEPICHAFPWWNHRGTTIKELRGTTGNLHHTRYACNQGILHAQETRGMLGKPPKPDSKSGGGNIVLVRVRPGAPCSILRPVRPTG